MMSYDVLTDDLWRYIGLKLDAGDRIRFRAVSKSWMALVPPPLWLMLAEEDEPYISIQSRSPASNEQNQDPDLNSVGDEHEKATGSSSAAAKPPPLRGFATIGEQQEIVYLNYMPLHRAHFVGSLGNWLIAAHSDKSLRILNPFAKQQFHLPPLTAFENSVLQSGTIHPDTLSPKDLLGKQLYKVVLSSPPSKGRDCLAMAIHHYRKILAFARLGDAQWTTLQVPDEPNRWAREVQDIFFYKGKFYACTNKGLLVCDIDDGPPRAVHLCKFPNAYSQWYGNYLVEWLGELLWVNKHVNRYLTNEITIEGYYRTSGFQVYKFDFIEKKWDEVKDLGEHSLFLGFNRSIALKSSDYGELFRKNCIYFTDDFDLGYRGFQIHGGRDMGVYDLSDKSITPHFRGVSTSRYSPPLWIIPIS